MKINNINNFFSNIERIDSKVPVFLSFLLFIFSSALIYLSIQMEIILYVSGTIIGLLLIALMFFFPKIWFYLIILGSAVFITQESEEISVIEIIMGLFLSGSLIIWLINHVLIHRRNVIKNPADLFFLIFILILPLNFIVAYFNGVETLGWVREYALYILFLLYFPIREYCKEEKFIKKILILFSIITAGIAIWQIYYYYTSIDNISFAVDLIKGKSANQHIFTTVIIFGVAFLIYYKKFNIRLLITVTTFMVFIGLIATFSRAYWLALIFNLILMFFFLERKQKLVLLLSSVLLMAMFLGVLYFFFENYFNIVMTVLGERFSSAGDLTDDPSMMMRFHEFETVFDRIKEHPIGGNGMHSEFKDYDPFSLFSEKDTFIHNAYISLAYRLGVIMPIFFFFPFIYYMTKSFLYARKVKSGFYRYLAIAVFTTIVMILITNMVTTTFIERDFIMTTIFVLGFAGIIDEKLRTKEFNILKQGDNQTNVEF